MQNGSRQQIAGTIAVAALIGWVLGLSTLGGWTGARASVLQRRPTVDLEVVELSGWCRRSQRFPSMPKICPKPR